MSLASIQELNALSFRDELSSAYEESYGSPPFDLSHWDPSEQTLRALLVHLKLPPPPCVLPYILPYELGEIKESVIKRLGLSPDGRDTLIVPTGTSAIAFSAWWLKVFNVERVVIPCPAYFSSFYACDMMRLEYARVHLRRESGEWHWPYEEIISAVGHNGCRTAVWITNPIYTTGVYLNGSQVDFLNSLLEQDVVVVLDECHAINGKELGPRLTPSEQLLGLYSPHKSVCINAAKFAAIVFDVKYQQFFADWTDVLVGGLSAANYTALLHFLSPNFDEFYNAFTERINTTRSEVVEIIRRYSALEIDHKSEGYLMTVYAPKVPALGNCEDVLRDIVFSTGATMIPGTRNHFSQDMGFNFRINLARACPQFTSALNRVAAHLASMG